jgi:hypothetical protein
LRERASWPTVVVLNKFLKKERRMSADSDLARAIASALLDWANAKDAANARILPEPTSLPESLGGHQREVAEMLRDAPDPDKGLPTRVIYKKLAITQPNAYGEVHRLAGKGIAELVPGSKPQHWRLVGRYRRLSS